MADIGGTLFFASADLRSGEAVALWSMGWLVAIAASWLISSGIGYQIFRRFGVAIDDWLSGTRGRRLAFALVLGGIVPLIATGMVEAADYSEMAQGRMTSASFWCNVALAPFAVAYLTGQYILWFHEENTGIRLSKAEMVRDEARADRDFVVLLNRTLLHVVQRQHERVKKALESSRGVVPLPTILNALAPNIHVAELVNIVYEIFHAEVTQRFPGQEVQVRVALFRLDGSATSLNLVHAWNGVTNLCVQSPRQRFQEKFQLIQVRECLAVYAAVHREVMIVPNAEEAHGSASCAFNYFDNEQRAVIKSTLAIPMAYPGQQGPAHYVLCVDSSSKELFHLAKRIHYEKIAENLAPRLHQADLIEELLKRASNPSSEAKAS